MILVMKGALQVVFGDPYSLPRQSSTQTDKTQDFYMIKANQNYPLEDQRTVSQFLSFGPTTHELQTQVDSPLQSHSTHINLLKLYNELIFKKNI